MTGSQRRKGWKGAITAQERHYLSKCKQASLLTKTSGDSGQSSSAWEGTPVVHPENWTAETGKVISRSDHARQTPELFGPGRLNRICASEGYLSAEPEQLRMGRCIHPRAGLRQFPASNVEPEWCAPQAGAGPAGLRHCEHTPVLFVCSIPPSPQHDWTREPKKKVSTTALRIRTEIRHWRDQQTEEIKRMEPPWK